MLHVEINGQPVKLFEGKRCVCSAADAAHRTGSRVLGNLQLMQDTGGTPTTAERLNSQL